MSAFVKGFIAFGFPTVATPLLTLFLDVKTAVVLLILPNIVMDALQFRRVGTPWAMVRRMGLLIVCGSVGMVLGTRLLVWMSPRTTTMILGLFLIPAIALYRELSKPSDIWWTPPSLMVPLTEAANRVRGYVAGKSLTALVEAGQLRIADGASSSVVAASDVGFRLNNYDRVRAERIPLLLAYAAMWVSGRREVTGF